MTEEEIEVVATALRIAVGDVYPLTYTAFARIAITALDSHRLSQGLVSVPREPTEGMLKAGRHGYDMWLDAFDSDESLEAFVYRAMIQAAEGVKP